VNSSWPPGSKVKINQATTAPDWSKWDDDRGRTCTSVKKQLRDKFYHGEEKLSVEVIYVAKESERERLRKQGRTKVRLRDPAGASIILEVDAACLIKSNK
jgi:hypothetical protein